jgi:hypothetical protein
MKLIPERTPEDDEGGPALDLAKAIEEFYQEFPEHRKTTFILNHQVHAAGQDAVESFSRDIGALEKANPLAKVKMAKSMAAGMFAGKLPCSISITESAFNGKPDMEIYGRIVIPAGDEFSARLLKSIFVSDNPLPNDVFPTMPHAFNDTEMWQRYVLDHELGHALTMLGIDRQASKTTSFGNQAECEADAYAMIRHFQRYGEGSLFPAYISDLRNMNALHKGDITHWTSRAVDRVIELNNAGALHGLTPAQSRDLAVKIAGETRLSADAEHNMEQAFATTADMNRAARKKKTPQGQVVMSCLEAACKIGAETRSPAVLDACRRYMDSIHKYIPADLPQSKAPQELKAMRDDHMKMMSRSLDTEPALPELKRVFRDALIDAQSGSKRKSLPKNDNKPKGPTP